MAAETESDETVAAQSIMNVTPEPISTPAPEYDELQAYTADNDTTYVAMQEGKVYLSDMPWKSATNVYGDGELLAQTDYMTGSDDGQALSVDVGNVQVLKLSATNNGSNNHNHADWADAKLTPKTQTVDMGYFGYCGEYYDPELDMIYLRNRYYSPGIGRFITEDPARDGVNWYAYCNNNPVMFVDPFGLFDYNTKLSKSNQYSSDVKVLQNELAWLGYYSGEIDGYFGQKTLDAVNWYKHANDLGNTGADWGVVGAQTWSSLGLIYRTRQDIDAGVQIITVGLKQYFDISMPVATAVQNAKKDFENHKLDVDWFIGQVKNQGRWNVKRNAQVWSDTLGISTNSYNKNMFFYGRPVVIDDIGNISYGYLGKAAGFSGAVKIYK